MTWILAAAAILALAFSALPLALETLIRRMHPKPKRHHR